MYTYLPQKDNQFVDALAKLASMVNILSGICLMSLMIKRRNKLSYCHTIEECSVGITAWYCGIYQYLIEKEYPPESFPKAQQALRLQVLPYFEDKGNLYKKTNTSINLLRVMQEKARESMKEVPSDECRPHMHGPMLAKEVQRMGYYWLTMEVDNYTHVSRGHKCQIYTNL